MLVGEERRQRIQPLVTMVKLRVITRPIPNQFDAVFYDIKNPLFFFFREHLPLGFQSRERAPWERGWGITRCPLTSRYLGSMPVFYSRGCNGVTVLETFILRSLEMQIVSLKLASILCEIRCNHNTEMFIYLRVFKRG